MKAKPKKTVTVKKEWQSSLDSFFSTTKNKNQAECAVAAAAATTASNASVNTVVAATNAIDTSTTTTSQTNSQLLAPEREDAILPHAMCRKRAREKDEQVPGSSGRQKPRVSFDLPASDEDLETAETTAHETPSLAIPDIQMAEMRLSDNSRLDSDTANDSNSATVVVATQVDALAVSSSPIIIDLDPDEPDHQEAQQDTSMPEAPELKVEQDKEEGTKTTSVENQAQAVPVRVTNAGGRNPGTCVSTNKQYIALAHKCLRI